MKKFYLLQNVKTQTYFAASRCDCYWTDDISDAKKFENSNLGDSALSEWEIDFLDNIPLRIEEVVIFNSAI